MSRNLPAGRTGWTLHRTLQCTYGITSLTGSRHLSTTPEWNIIISIRFPLTASHHMVHNYNLRIP